MSDAAESPVAPLSIETDLDVRVDGYELTTRSTGDRLFVDLPSLRAAVAVARGGDVDQLPTVATALRQTDLTVEVRIREATVGLVGAEATPGELERELSLSALDLRIGGAVTAVGREVVAAASWVGERL
ncbi:MAG: hypothetical protein ABEJ79_01435 [Halolamina sp.]